eukprot:752009-Hanusia_phi.AAC.4
MLAASPLKAQSRKLFSQKELLGDAESEVSLSELREYVAEDYVRDKDVMPTGSDVCVGRTPSWI